MMPTLSRRRFLQLVGITLVGNALRPNHLVTALPAPVYTGRALTALPVYAAPHREAAIIKHIWPDSMVSLLDTQADWYRLPEGYVQREGLQPVERYVPPKHISMPEDVFWGEVSAPVAPIREWCAADAPSVTRIGQGGVARVIDALPGQREGSLWYGLESEQSGLLGWSQAIYWRPTPITQTYPGEKRIKIARNRQQLSVIDQNKIILDAPVSLGEAIPEGIYTITKRQPGGMHLAQAETATSWHGVPWIVAFGDGYQLSGAYWHNRFGAAIAGKTVQISPLLARWLYHWLGDDATIIVTV
jgi:hypothetical protein